MEGLSWRMWHSFLRQISVPPEYLMNPKLCKHALGLFRQVDSGSSLFLFSFSMPFSSDELEKRKNACELIAAHRLGTALKKTSSVT